MSTNVHIPVVPSITNSVKCTGGTVKLKDLNKVQLSIQNVSVLALLDSGASISCMSKAFYDSLPGQSKSVLHESKVLSIQGVSGKCLQVMGQVTVSVVANRLKLFHTFQVIKDLPRTVILGVDFLSEHKASINWTNNTLQVQNGLTEIPLHAQNSQSHVAKTVKQVSIPPNCEMLIHVKVKLPKITENVLFFDPLTSLPTKHHVLGAKSIAKVHNGKSIIRLFNFTNSTVTLPTHTPVALAAQSIAHIFEEQSNPNLHEVCTTTHTHQQNTDKNNTQEQSEHYIAKAKRLGFDLHDSDLTDSQKTELLIFLGKNSDVFASKPSELGTYEDYEHYIDTGTAPPIRQRYYRTSPKIRQEIDRQIADLTQNGVLEAAADNAWLSPVILVKKKDNTYRFACDFRAVNRVSTPMTFPQIQFQSVVDELGHAKANIFSVLDCFSGFHQLKLHPETKHKTGIITESGCWQFRKLPFGLMNSPSAFNLVMSKVLSGLLFKFALAYLDDILAYSSSFEQHLEHLKIIFDRFRKAGIKFKPSKCVFAKKAVTYLGHTLTKDGISVNSDKVSVIKNYKRPKNQKQVKQFIGCITYYKKFIKNFCHIVVPLNKLLKLNEPFVWDEKCEKSFQTLKNALVSADILVYPDFSKEFILHTDASDYSLGYILGQRDEQGRERVIAYGGRALTPNEVKFPVTHKECLGIISAIRHFHVYLAHSKFTVYTDHKALTSLPTNKRYEGRLARWALFLQQYNYTVQAKKGTHNSNADFLSRIHYPQSTHREKIDEESGLEIMSCNHTTTPLLTNNQATVAQKATIEYTLHYTTHTHNSNQQKPINTLTKLMKAENDYHSVAPMNFLCEVLHTTAADIQSQQKADPKLQPLFNYLQNDILPEDSKLARTIVAESPDYVLDNGVLYHLYYPRGKGHKLDRVIKQLVVPHQLQNDVLRSYHDSITAGHQGLERTYQAVRMKYFWKSMFGDIQIYIKTCEDCQQVKRNYHNHLAPLKPLEVEEPFSTLHLDHIGPFPTSSEGYKYCLVVIDRFTKFPECFPTRSTDAVETARILYHQIICRYGFPRKLLSDRAQGFMSKLIAELCKIFQITKVSTSSYHPQTNSSAERFNQSIIQHLKLYCHSKQSTWPDILSSIMLAYRASPAVSSHQFSPYFLLFGREMTLALDTSLEPNPSLPKSTRAHLHQLLTNHEEARKIAKDNILKAQQKYSKYYDRSTQPPKFQVGHKVWLFCSRVLPGTSAKMVRSWQGPFYICQKFSNYTFKLRRCDDNKLVKSVCHANRLKPYYDPETRPTNPPHQLQGLNRNFNSELLHDQQDSEPLHCTNTTPDNNTRLFTVQKILSSAMVRGKRCYKVKFVEKSGTEWVPASDISEALIQDFHIKKTLSGKARKRPLRR